MNKKFSVLWVMIALLSGLCGENTPFTEGHQCFKNGKFKEARSLYVKAVLANPLDGLATLYLGHAFFTLKEYSNAEYCLRRGIEFITDPDFEMALIATFPNEKSFLTHKKELEKAYQLHNTDISLQVVLSYLYFFSGEIEQAKLLFHQIALLDPKDRFAKFFIERINREEQKCYLARFSKTEKNVSEKLFSENTSSSPNTKEDVPSSEVTETIKTGEKESFSTDKTKNTFSH